MAALGWVRRYQRALAQPTHRKLALLIGIDQYSNQVIDPALTQDVSLRGAITDVELQRELLIYRFGFQPQDIVTLTDRAATRQNILDAVNGHLVQQAETGDVVLLHFSGYGSRVRLIDQPETLRRSLVPIDGLLPSEEHPEVQDLLEAELRGVLRSLKTNQITTVLDAGYRDLGQIRWGMLKVRSRPTTPTGVLVTPLDDLLPDEQGLGWPGLLLRAASPDRLALEGEWAGFHAGAFTYALTQTLWETLPSASLQVVLNQTAERIQRWTGPDQQPELSGKRRADSTAAPYYAPLLRTAADGMITGASSDSGTVSLWMGGIAPSALAYLQPNSRLVVMPIAQAEADSLPQSIELTIQSRSGLTAAAKVPDGGRMPEVGQPVYEQVRILPKTIDLTVALDPTLERVERVDATSALSGLPYVSATTKGEQLADCLFGRLPKVPAEPLTAALPGTTDVSSQGLGLAQTAEPEGLERSYGLFSPNRTLLPGTLIAKEEAVKTAVNRLAPHLQMLLAMKLLRLTANAQASQLAVRVSLEATHPEEQLLAQWETLHSPLPLPKSRLTRLAGTDARALRVNRDSRLRYRVSNYTSQALYLAFVRFDSRGQFLALVPDVPKSRPLAERQSLIAEGAALAPGETRSIPEQPADWGVAPLVTWVEAFLVFSTVPFEKTWDFWQNGGDVSQQPGLARFDQPLKVARALLADLHEGSLAYDAGLAAVDQYKLHMASWATIQVRYPVV